MDTMQNKYKFKIEPISKTNLTKTINQIHSLQDDDQYWTY